MYPFPDTESSWWLYHFWILSGFNEFSESHLGKNSNYIVPETFNSSEIPVENVLDQ